ncbi:class IV lanthionine synthetase LanL [Amycolatopsis magusensis]|uniref:class IV lanthionine synthetase LanL n=1 Tax=Amycolatopsis magusensis TaxID=882444 RepID=UPI00379AB549
MTRNTGDDLEPIEIARAVLDEDWTLVSGTTWTSAVPRYRSVPHRLQGWKLHIAATPVNAAAVLRAVASVLVQVPARFKFSPTRQDLAELNGWRAARESSGKFITIYPRDDEELLSLAQHLCAVLDGQSGPVILSDRRVRSTAPVYYRFGGFNPHVRFRPEGTLRLDLETPDGELVEDQRRAWFVAPNWAPDPFGGQAEESAPEAHSVLLQGRYVVAQAIRHANRGGVYLALDRQSGIRVVIKEGRAGVGVTVEEPVDTTDLLAYEVELLRKHPELPTAVLLDSFWQDGNFYAVTEHLPGETLADCARRLLGEPNGSTLPIAESLCDTLEDFHRTGLVVRDFSPSNVIVTDDACRLVDLELAHPAGEAPRYLSRSGTPGFMAPEQFHDRRGSVAADLYSLGAVLVFLFAGCTTGDCLGRDDRAALLGWIELLSYRGALSAPAAVLVTDLAEGRIATAREARGRLRELAGATGASTRHDSDPPLPVHGYWRTGRSLADQLVAINVRWLQRILSDPGQELPLASSAQQQDPLSVQSGHAGPILALSLWAAYGSSTPDEPSVHTLATSTRNLVAAMIDRSPAPPRSLYFGEAGTVIAIAAASTVVDLGLQAEAEWRARALALPSEAALPDLCHGTAGLSMAHLTFWRATATPQHLAKSVAAAEALLDSAVTRDRQLCWPIAENVDSEMAGATYTGYAHGTAGIAAALMTHLDTECADRAPEFGVHAMEQLAATRTTERGKAYWPHEVGGTGRGVFWCNGSVGIGRALVQAWHLSNTPELLTAALEAAEAGSFELLQMGPARCHGVLGLLELWLDLTDTSAADRAQAAVDDITLVLTHRCVIDHDTVVLPDETSSRVTIGYNTGAAGMIPAGLRAAGIRVPDLLLGDWIDDSTVPRAGLHDHR